jgi:hypothetical protein
MNRSLLLAAFAAVLVACGGKTGSPEFDESSPAFEQTKQQQVYFGVTNTLDVVGKAVASVDLNAASQVELMVVTKDGSPLRYDLYFVWRGNGQRELLAPVDRRSGFHVTTFQPKQSGRYEIELQTESPKRIIVHLACKEGRCSPSRQPGETCAPGFQCADGLACCDGDLWSEGRCKVPEGFEPPEIK